MNKRKLLMALVGACLACNVAMANAAGVEYMGGVSTSYNQEIQDVSVVDSMLKVERSLLSKQNILQRNKS